MPANALNELVEFLRLPAVKLITGLGTTKIYQMAKDGTFPHQVRLGGRSAAWIKSEVLEWNREQVNRSRGHCLPPVSDDQQPMSNQG